MGNKINVAEMLKNCPEGMELNCTIYEGAELDYVTNDKKYPIKIIIKDDIDGNIGVSLTKEGYYNVYHNPKCVIFPKGKTTWEGFVPPCKFKDGDIISDSLGTCIFKGEGVVQGTVDYYCGVNSDYFNVKQKPDGHYGYIVDYRLATKEEKQKLFQAIKDNGYMWNAETKTLEKLIEPKFKAGDRIKHKCEKFRDERTVISYGKSGYWTSTNDWIDYESQDDWELVPNKFDISTLKPFDKVLVRDNNTQEWVISFFSRYNNLVIYKYSCINGNGYAQCVPYEANKNLLGTTNDCDEFYKTWE